VLTPSSIKPAAPPLIAAGQEKQAQAVPEVVFYGDASQLQLLRQICDLINTLRLDASYHAGIPEDRNPYKFAVTAVGTAAWGVCGRALGNGGSCQEILRPECAPASPPPAPRRCH